MKNLKLINMIFESNNGTNRIYEAMYDDEACYCIEHTGSGVKVLINHSEELLDKIIQKIKRTYALAVDFHGSRPTVKFHTKIDNQSGRVIGYGRPLRHFVYAYYHDIDIRKILRHKIIMLDEALLEDNILDFREENLFDLGGERTEGIAVLSRPNYPLEKYIFITRDGVTEVQDYSEGLYEILTKRKYSGVSRNRITGRHSVVVRYKKNKYKKHNLSHVVAIYNDYFGQYKLIRNFVHNFPRMSQIVEDEEKDVAHINAHKWNNTKYNLMLMESESNRKMSDYITEFIGEYNAFPIVIQENRENIILVRLVNKGKELYYKCPTEKHYCNLQLTLLGKSNLLERLSMRQIGDVACDVDTPKQAYERIKQKNKQEYNEADFWRWCDIRDNMLMMYKETPQVFKEWTGDNIDRNERQSVTIDTLVNEIIPYLSATFQ